MQVILILFAVMLIAYLTLGTVQLLAIADGLRVRGFSKGAAIAAGLLIAYLPVIGSAAGVYGAVIGWGWTVTQGLARLVAPLLVMAAILVLG